MKKSLFALAAVACFGLMSAGCDEDSLNKAIDDLVEGNIGCSALDKDEDKAEACEKLCEEAGVKCGDAGACLINKLNGVASYSCTPTEEVCTAQGLVITNVINKTADGAEYNAYNCAAAAQDVTCNKDADCDVNNGYKCDIDGDYVQMNHCYNPADYGVSDEEYKYVKVQDESPVNSKGEDPGADIDAIVLQKADGSQYYAADIKSYHRGDGTSNVEKDKAFNPNAILGAPDSVLDVTNPDGKCNYLDMEKSNVDDNGLIYTFVSLGGKTEGKDGGYIIVEMQKAAEVGDKLFVVELGNCDLVAETTQSGKSSTAGAEAISVSVSVSDDYSDGVWVPVINSSTAIKGVVTGSITTL